MSEPTIDLSSTDLSQFRSQLDVILDQVDDQHKEQILKMLSGQTPSTGDIIEDYGEPTADDGPTSSDIDTIYRSVFKASNLDAVANPFLRIEELYDAVMQEEPGSYDTTTDNGHGGLFTNISENTMAAIYEAIYNKPMNYADYETYLAHGTPNYYTPAETRSLTNDDDESSQNYNFNQDTLTPSMLNKIVVDNNYDDERYRSEQGITDDTSNDREVSPYSSGSAIRDAYLLIHNLLLLPVQQELEIPVEAALYFTDLQVTDNHYVKLPSFVKDKSKLTRVQYHNLFKLSNCACVVLKDIIGNSDTVYNRMPTNSLISYQIESDLRGHHAAIFALCKKVLLELYALCYAIKYPDKYLDYLTVKDLRVLRKGLLYLKHWSSHFERYRNMVEVWDELEIAVGYVYPYFKGILDSTDLHYTDRQFNDNYL